MVMDLSNVYGAYSCHSSVMFTPPVNKMHVISSYVKPDEHTTVLSPLTALSAMDDRDDGPWLSKEEIGKKIKAIRSRNGLSQQELADLCGIPEGQASVSRWERGVLMPSYEKLLIIAKLVGRGVEIFQVNDDFSSQNIPSREVTYGDDPTVVSNLPDVSFLQPRARGIYNEAIGDYVTRGWPRQTIAEAAWDFWKALTGANSLNSSGPGKRELTEDEQCKVLNTMKTHVETAYGPNGVIRKF